MGQHKITFTYCKAGIQPPLFVAGTFSDPEWEPQEMSYIVNKDGQHEFCKEVAVEGVVAIQYKFRIGPGDWWVLDETAEQVSDGRGNTNNVMQIAPTSVEKLDDEPDDTGPMFSHECLGDDRSHEDPQENHTSPKSKTPLDPSPEHNGFILKRGIGENYEDPRLEVFPSDNCESIVAAIRQIEASTKEDRSIPEETSSSPTMPIIVGSNGNLPVSELQSQRLKAPKISRGSMHSDRSYTSLESIQETPEVGIRRMPVGISESAITDSADEEDDNIDVAGSDDGPDQSKRSTSPAIAADELDPVQPTLTLETPSDEDENVGKTVSSTARVESSLLRKRGPANPSERPASPTSGRSIQEASKHGNWLQGILRIVFVEWVGGFFSRVFRSFRREALLTLLGTAALIVGLLWNVSKDSVRKIVNIRPPEATGQSSEL